MCLTAGAFVPVAVAEEPHDLLPDLRMTVYGVRLATSVRGIKKLHFGTLVANLGDGPLEVRGHGRDHRTMLNPAQWITQSDGTMRKVDAPDVNLFYSGDGHDHFHIQGFNFARLTPVNVPGRVNESERYLRKIGFCLFDVLKVDKQERPPNSVRRSKYYDCGKRDSQSVRMGISVGYQDDYRPFIARQSIVVQGMQPGTYELCVTTNNKLQFIEKPDSLANNSYRMLLRINVNKDLLEVLEQGQSTCGGLA
jgi:hypothetical protein